MHRILLIDDDLNLLGAIARFLRDEGFEVRVCDQPTQTLDLVTSWQPALVVTDLKMPQFSGLGILRDMRQYFPQVPVLLFSAFGTTPDVVAAIELGAAGFLEKTEAPETLLSKVQQALKGARPPMGAVPKIGGAEKPLNDRVRSFERALIEQALRDSGGSVKGALETLGVSRRTLNEKMQRLGIQRAQDQNQDQNRDQNQPNESMSEATAKK